MYASSSSSSSSEKRNEGETRANKAALEQIRLLNRCRSAEILDDANAPPLVVDHGKLKDLLSRVVTKTDGAEVEPLEKLYALLAQCIYRHRNTFNKTELVKEMKKEIDRFS